jgi:predicted membrane metal-binding protein
MEGNMIANKMVGYILLIFGFFNLFHFSRALSTCVPTPLSWFLAGPAVSFLAFICLVLLSEHRLAKKKRSFSFSSKIRYNTPDQKETSHDQ